MRIIATISLFFLVSTFVYTQDYRVLDISEEGEQVAYITKDCIYMVFDYEQKYSIINTNKLAINDEGYLTLSYKDKKYLIIDGDVFLQYFDKFSFDGENKYVDEEGSLYHDFNLLSVSSSSFLAEQIGNRNIKYTPDNLFKAFYLGCSCHPYWWNDTHIPWVEGVDGNGIGENITISFKEPVKVFSILNGYVDINNTKLFFENSRAKEIRVYYTNQKYIDVKLPDMVYFKLIELPQETKNIKIEIIDVYKGSKYQDTCISAIINHRSTRTIQNRDEEIKLYLDKVIRNYRKVD
jgi:hypothetical protein